VYNVNTWSSEDVGQWLDNMSLSEYRDSFIRNEIRGIELLSLDKTDIQVQISQILKYSNVPLEKPLDNKMCSLFKKKHFVPNRYLVFGTSPL